MKKIIQLINYSILLIFGALFLISNFMFSYIRNTLGNEFLFEAFREFYPVEMTPDFHFHNLFISDNLSFLFIGLFLTVIFFYIFYRIYIKLGIKKIIFISLFIQLIFGIFIIKNFQVVLQWDSKDIFNVADNILHANYEDFYVGRYIGIYPFQLNVSLLVAGYKVLFHNKAILAFRITNLLLHMLDYYFLYKITDELFHNEHVNKIFWVLVLLFPQHLFYITYVYPNSFYITCSIVGIYQTIRYVRDHKLIHLFLTMIVLTIGSLLKMNTFIVTIGVVMYLLCNLTKERRKNSYMFLFIAMFFIAPMVISSWVKSYFELLSGIRLENYLPFLHYLGIGLFDYSLGPGWHDTYYQQMHGQYHSFSTALTKEFVIQDILLRLKEYLSQPSLFFNFQFRKFASGWASPELETLYINAGMIRENIQKSTVQSFMYGELRIYWFYFCNALNNFFALSFFISVVKFTKKIFFPGIIVIGGFLFHILWEMKPQYIMLYRLIMIVYSSYGIYLVISYYKKKNVEFNSQKM